VRSFTTRIEHLERVVAPAPEAIHILRVVVDPRAPGDRVTGVIARGAEGTLTSVTRLVGETKEQLCERALQAIGSG